MGVGLIKRQVDLVVKRSFADFDGGAEFRGNGFGEGLGFLFQRVVGDMAVDQAQFERDYLQEPM